MRGTAGSKKALALATTCWHCDMTSHNTWNIVSHKSPSNGSCRFLLSAATTAYSYSPLLATYCGTCELHRLSVLMEPIPNDAEGPSRKRARVDNSSNEEGGEIAETTQEARKRDKEFWYEDGTVIFVTRNVEFRMCKGLLADHSPVFRDMFSLPQPPDPPEADCTPRPVVHLADSPEGLRYVLRIYMARGDPRCVLLTNACQLRRLTYAAYT